MDLTPTKNVEKILSEVFKKINSHKDLVNKIENCGEEIQKLLDSMDRKTHTLYEKRYLDFLEKHDSYIVIKGNSFGPGLTVENWKKSAQALIKNATKRMDIKDTDFINLQEKEKFIAALKLNEEYMKLNADIQFSWIDKVKVDIKTPKSVLKQNADLEKYVKQLEKVPGVNRSFLESVKKAVFNTGKITAGCAVVAAAFSVTLRQLNDFKVKYLVKGALNSYNYKDLSKYIKALKKTQNSSWFTTAMSTKEVARQSLNEISKSYIGIGTCMILVSVVISLLLLNPISILSDLVKAVKSLNKEALMESVEKLFGLGLIIVPALIGACLIYVGLTGFKNEGIAAKILSVMSPVIKMCNMVTKNFVTQLK